MTETRINPESLYGAPYGGSYQRPSDARPGANFPYAEQATPFPQAPPDAWNGGAWNGNPGPPAPQQAAYQQQRPSYPPGAPGYQQGPGYQTDPSLNQPRAPYPPPGAGYPPSPPTPPPGSGYGQRTPAGYPTQAAAATGTMTPPPFPAVPGPGTPPPFPAVPGPGTPPPFPAVPGPGTPPPFPAVPGGPGSSSEPTLFRVLREREQQQAYGQTYPPGPAQAYAQPYGQAYGRAPTATIPYAGPRVVDAEVTPSREFRRQQAEVTSETAQVALDEDEKLLQAIKKIVSFVKNDSLFPRLIFIILGYTAIGPLSLAYIELLPLPVGASMILLPAVLTMIALGIRYPEWGRRALIGWMAGIVATIIYDVSRLAAVEMGVFGDPIPAIGNLLLVSDTVPWWVGYVWRLLGNGGGMAIAFTMLPWRGARAGFIYGTLIVSGLVAVLYFFPVAQVHFFPLTPLTAAVGTLGHWIYGVVLGIITKRFLPPPRVSLVKDGG